MKARTHAWVKLLVRKYDHVWEYLKAYSRKCRGVYRTVLNT